MSVPSFPSVHFYYIDYVIWQEVYYITIMAQTCLSSLNRCIGSAFYLLARNIDSHDVKEECFLGSWSQRNKSMACQLQGRKTVMTTHSSKSAYFMITERIGITDTLPRSHSRISTNTSKSVFY